MGTTARNQNLPECRAGECYQGVGEIKGRYEYIKRIGSRSGGKSYHVVRARDGYYAFIKMNGKFYATDRYSSLENLEKYIF